jgi:hypothetical protein
VRPLRRTLITVLALATASLALVACGGDESAGDSAARFSDADATRLARIAPVTPGWPAWPTEPDEKRASTETAEQAAARDPLYAEYRRKTAHVVRADSSAGGNHWQDDVKLANLVVEVLASPEDAHIVFEASTALSRGYGDLYGDVTKAEPVNGLGEEAWRLWASGNGPQVTYHWRRDNLVVEVHVHCFGVCPSDVDGAARAWAEAIDADARRVRGGGSHD